MQSVKFDSAEVEARQEKLREYKYNVEKAIQELDSNLQSLIYDTQKVIDDLCYNSNVRTSDDGALGKINYVLKKMPQRIGYINGTIARVSGTLMYWQNIADKLSIDFKVLNDEIGAWEKQVEDIRYELMAIPDGYWESTTITYSDGSTSESSEWYDPWEGERDSLRAKRDSIYEFHLTPLRSERNEVHGKLIVAQTNCSIASGDLNKLNSFLTRCNSILSTAKKDDEHIKKTLKSLSEIIESLKKYREKLGNFSESVMGLIQKADKILNKALSAITELMAISHKHIPDFENRPIKVQFDIDECKKYKVNGDEFNEEIESLYKYLVGIISGISSWNDNNKNKASTAILSHAEAMKSVVNIFDNEMDFLKKQIKILTDYYNAIE